MNKLTLRQEIEKSFPRIEKLFTDELLIQFSNTSPEDLDRYNLGLGSMIRIKLLRPKGTLYKKFIQAGTGNTDRMAMQIIREFHRQLPRK